MIHGILASVTFLFLFPLGSIAMATIKGRWAYWVHVVSQMIGWFMFIAVAALGFRMLDEVRVRTRQGRESLVSLLLFFGAFVLPKEWKDEQKLRVGHD